VYLAWFICTYPRALSLPHTLLLHLAAVWAATEVWFVFYYAQMTRDIQPVSPATDMKHDQLSDLFLRVLHAGLRVNAPLSRSRAYSAPGAWPEVRASVESILQAIAEGHHPADATGAEDTKVESEVKAAFGVTSVPDSVTAEAAARAVKAARRRMTRLDSTAAQMPYEEDPDPLFDDDGRPRVLSSDDPRAIEFREQLRTWFYHAPWEKIHAQDVQHWLAWSAFSMPLDEVRKNPKKARFLDRTFTMLEARTGTKFPPGRSGVKVVLLTLDPIRTRHRPLFIYVLTNTVNWFIRRIYYPHRGGIVYREGDIE
jgi:hypothetical protein